MLNATYGEGTAISTNANRFNENVTGYDKNGNIKTLLRYGQTAASTYGLVDNLTYILTGNLLNRVDDATTATAYGTATAFSNGANAAGEYAYDANGNLTKDLNKGISNIQYNVLNLPGVVTYSDGSTITYSYAADGSKLRTVHVVSGTTTQTDYCGNVIYEGGAQKYLLTQVGYVDLNGAKQYHYYLKDHQGNVRVVMNQNGTTVEETNHYYPFGGLFASTNAQPFKYNGKELDTKKSLNWYDYGARHYDPVLGRFATGDPKSEILYPWNPYAYCVNNPVKFVDEDGELPRIFIEKKGFGHAFVTVGSGSNTIVYTYGRYGDLNKDKSVARNTTLTGEGVLIKLTGNEAVTFIQNQMLENEAIGYEFSKGADEDVTKYFDDKMNSSHITPQTGRYAGNKNAKVIDEYNLLNNNCVTTSVKGIQSGVNSDLELDDVIMPRFLDDKLSNMSEENSQSIRKISYDEIKREFNLHGVGTKW